MLKDIGINGWDLLSHLAGGSLFTCDSFISSFLATNLRQNREITRLVLVAPGTCVTGVDVDVLRIIDFISYDMIVQIIKKIHAIGEVAEGNLLASWHFASEESGGCVDTFYH